MPDVHENTLFWMSIISALLLHGLCCVVGLTFNSVVFFFYFEIVHNK